MSGGMSTEMNVGGGYNSRVPGAGLQLALRFAQFLVSLIGFSVMASARKEGVSFNDFHAFSFLVGITFLAGAYAFVLMVFCAIKLFSSDKAFSNTAHWILLGWDAFFILFVWGAAMAAAGVATANVKGVYNDSSLCSKLDSAGFGTFCHKAEAAIAMTYFASFFFMASFWFMVRATTRAY